MIEPTTAMQGYPHLAPLGTTLIYYYLEYVARPQILRLDRTSRLELMRSQASNTALMEGIAPPPGFIEADAWQQFSLQVADKRRQVYTLMRSHIHTDQNRPGASVTPSWFRQTLVPYMPDEHLISPQRISKWSGDGENTVLRTHGWGLLDADSVAALLIMRMLDQRERGWFPSWVDAHEPYWWCWAQTTPDTEPFPCPIPTPGNLPADTLLWSPWAGASWTPPWFAIGSLGAIRWAGADLEGEQVRWTLTKKQLLKWDPKGKPLERRGLLERREVAFHNAAHDLLLDLALPRLGASPSLLQ